MNAIIFRDLLLSMLLGMVALVVLANFEPTVDNKDLVNPPGNLIVSITWEAGPTDVDLWLMAPGEDKPVGYSNKDGKVWNLLRDDTGVQGHDIGINYENAFSRGLPEGEYIVNLHAYRVTANLKVQFEVAINNRNGTPMSVLFADTITLKETGEEVTAVRFKIGTDGKVDPNSIHRITTKLRGA